MDGIKITGVPFSMAFDMPQLEDLTRLFAELNTDIQKLDDGTTGLAGGGGQLGQAYDRLHKGLVDMQADLSQLTSGISQLAEKGDGLRGGSGQSRPSRGSRQDILGAIPGSLPLTLLNRPNLGPGQELSQQGDHYSGRHGCTYDARHVGAHSVHKQEVGRIRFLTFNLGDTGSHWHCGNARRPD